MEMQKKAGVVSVGQKMFPGRGWAWSRGLNRCRQKKVPGREAEHMACCLQVPLELSSHTCLQGVVPMSFPQRSLS